MTTTRQYDKRREQVLKELKSRSLTEYGAATDALVTFLIEQGCDPRDAFEVLDRMNARGDLWLSNHLGFQGNTSGYKLTDRHKP